ncbi:MAG: glycosyltransferase family A protein [Oscillospiraceae bacterium]|nr:glycosyltransferase family A protein [Oscillospiraceae bacterium]
MNQNSKEFTNPCIAVIVPVHNGEAFLPDCLSAIEAQSFRDFSCIVVDDGSTDRSAALADGYEARDRRFVVLRQRQSGVAAARAAGVRAGQNLGAQWFAFCDADDLYHPRFLEALVGAARSSGQLIACCRYDCFTGTVPADGALPEGTTILQPPAHLDALLHDHNVDFGLWNKLYSAELMTPEMLDNGLSYNEDLMANWDLFGRAGGAAYLDFAGYHYRQHADSASHRALPPESIDQQRQAAVYIREHAAPEIQQSANAFYYEKLVYLSSMILRRDDPSAYRVQVNELWVGIRAGLKDPNLGRNPRLPLRIRIAAWATIHCPELWRKVCRAVLKDRR